MLPCRWCPCRCLGPAAAVPVSVRRLPSPSSWSSTSLRVVRCMAKERRVRMVAKQIQRELADMLTRDPVMQRAVLPEAALGADRYLSSLTTIADVELSNDLQVCKVYVSVFGDERGRRSPWLAQGQEQVRQEPDWQADEAAPHARDTLHRGRVHGARKQDSYYTGQTKGGKGAERRAHQFL
ncbi:hypothetical protein ZWY2020_041443 [Hordeum vulgare]|nr:hypothetical protein ZWY2020_041443 [Hordeum vulgare]